MKTVRSPQKFRRRLDDFEFEIDGRNGCRPSFTHSLRTNQSGNDKPPATHADEGRPPIVRPGPCHSVLLINRVQRLTPVIVTGEAILFPHQSWSD